MADFKTFQIIPGVLKNKLMAQIPVPAKNKVT